MSLRDDLWLSWLPSLTIGLFLYLLPLSRILVRSLRDHLPKRQTITPLRGVAVSRATPSGKPTVAQIKPSLMELAAIAASRQPIESKFQQSSDAMGWDASYRDRVLS